jgi:hypothetical protein
MSGSDPSFMPLTDDGFSVFASVHPQLRVLSFCAGNVVAAPYYVLLSEHPSLC